jgi:hypothetical protein
MSILQMLAWNARGEQYFDLTSQRDFHWSASWFVSYLLAIRNHCPGIRHFMREMRVLRLRRSEDVLQWLLKGCGKNVCELEADFRKYCSWAIGLPDSPFQKQ